MTDSSTTGQTYAYARVSTTRQTNDQQIHALIAAGIREDRIYQEQMSGLRNDRPELSKVLNILQPGDSLTVWKLDRLGRDTIQILTTVRDLKDRDIIVRSLTDGLDSSTTTGRMVLGILASVAEYEVELKKERAEAKRKLIRARGGNLGGAKPKLNPEQTAALRRAHENGETVAGLARIFGVTRPTVYKALEGQR